MAWFYTGATFGKKTKKPRQSEDQRGGRDPKAAWDLF